VKDGIERRSLAVGADTQCIRDGGRMGSGRDNCSSLGDGKGGNGNLRDSTISQSL
jgi:hypothetical protein